MFNSIMQAAVVIPSAVQQMKASRVNGKATGTGTRQNKWMKDGKSNCPAEFSIGEHADSVEGSGLGIESPGNVLLGFIRAGAEDIVKNRPRLEGRSDRDDLSCVEVRGEAVLERLS